tara:strand:- start:560 stop:793 length:234 start_codon:yes stop_codon:yes gene_type:complete
MGWKARSLKNILELSEKEKWSRAKKEIYLKKIKYRIEILNLFLSKRNSFVDILTSYIENKANELNEIYKVLEEKWEK